MWFHSMCFLIKQVLSEYHIYSALVYYILLSKIVKGHHGHQKKWNQSSILGHSPSSWPSGRNSYQQLLKYELERTQSDRLMDGLTETWGILIYISLGFTFYGVIIVNQWYCGSCEILCCLYLSMKSITSWWHTQCVKCLILTYLWFGHNWPVPAGLGYRAYGWLVAIYQLAIGCMISAIYRLYIGWQLAGY